MSGADHLLSIARQGIDGNDFKELNWTGSFKDYLNKVHENPLIAHRRRPSIGSSSAERRALVPVPIGFFDGHADTRPLGEADDQGVPNQPYFNSQGPVLTTTDGFRGRDF